MPIDSKDLVTGFLDEWATSVALAIRENLESKGEYFRRSTLAQEITALPIESTNDGYIITIQMPLYGQFVDQGVRGTESSAKAPQSPYSYKTKKPPVEDLVLWIKKRGDINIALSAKKKAKLKSLKSKTVKKAFKQRSFDFKVRQVAFGMSVNIKKEGTTATHFYSEIVNDDMVQELAVSLGAKYGQLFEAQIVEP